MTSMLLASALLAANLAAAPEAPAAKPAAAAAPAAAPAAMPAMPAGHDHAAHAAAATNAKAATPVAPAAPKPVPLSAASLKDARQALLGPCSPEMATGKVTAVEVLDGNQLNAQREKEKSTKPKADPQQRFMAVSYTAGKTTGKSVRQVSTQYMLTTQQAKVLVGEKLCVFKE